LAIFQNVGPASYFVNAPHNPEAVPPHNTKEHEEQAIVDIAWCYRYAFVCTHVTNATSRELSFASFKLFNT
jgi:hypothetical protein